MNNRVWVYLSDKLLSHELESFIVADLNHFLAGWNAHGTALSASAGVLHHRFIVIKADEENYSASGCSIDKQFQFIKVIENKYQLSLLNRLLVAYKEGSEVKVVHSAKVPEMLASGEMNENTVIYNVGVGNDAEFESQFEIPLSKSWLAKFLVVK